MAGCAGAGTMIAGRGSARSVEWLAGRRRRQLERLDAHAVSIQEATLLRLVARAADTEFGLAHGFAGIRTVSDYQSRVPIREYRDFRPWWQRGMLGQANLTWPGSCRDWVTTSGTTDRAKTIPLTRDAF